LASVRTAVLALLLAMTACASLRRLVGLRDVALPVREGYVTTDDGIRLFFRVVGSGRDTMVAVHGGPGLHMGSLVDFEALAAGGTVILYDQRGGGLSSLPRDSSQLTGDRHVADLGAIWRHFRLGRVNLLGHSWGGYLAARYAIEHSDRIRRLVLVAPLFPRAIPYATQYFGRLPALLGADAARFRALNAAWDTTSSPHGVCRELVRIIARVSGDDPTTTERIVSGICSERVSAEALRRGWTTTPRWTMSSLGMWDLRAGARGMRAPVLVIVGSRDPSPSAAHREWVESFPSAQLQIVEGAGHYPFASDPERFASLVRVFLGRD
jgi:proline iminopeptidase